MKVSGLHQLSKHYNSELTVELASVLADGSQFAVKLKQIRPLVYMALGKSIPIKSGQQRELTPEELQDWHMWKRDLVSQCLVQFRSVIQEDGSEEWSEVWEPVTLVKENPDASKNQITIEDFDFLDNIDRCVVALMEDVNASGVFEEFKDANFRPKRSDNDSVASKKLQQQTT